MNNKNVYYKYQKYSHKLNKMAQAGGANNPILNISQTEYVKKMENYRAGVILNPLYKQDPVDRINDSFKTHLTNLDKLVDWTNDHINLDFLNEFNSNIYYDIHEDTYAVNNDQFINKNLNYKVDKKLGSKTGGGEIYFLTNNEIANNKNLPKELVLKVYIDENFGTRKANMFTNGYTRNPLLENYIPLNMEMIFPEKNDNKALINLTVREREVYKKEWNTVNYNSIPLEHLFNLYGGGYPEVNNKKLWLSVKSQNFYNEIFNYLVMRKIEQESNFNLKIVKYYNFYIASINNDYRGCVLMEKLDGNLGQLMNSYITKYLIELAKNDTTSKDKTTNSKILNSHVVKAIIDELTPTLNLLKSNKYMFTHTDLKIENIFYNKTDVTDVISDYKLVFSVKNQDIKYINNGNKLDLRFEIYEDDGRYLIVSFETDGNVGRYYKYEFKLADFDKSSISYHGVRFYSTYQSVLNKFKTFQPENYSIEYLNFDTHQNQLDDDKLYYYPTQKTDLNVPWEVVPMRYLPFPFYLGWDYQSILVSLSGYSEFRSDDYFDDNMAKIYNDLLGIRYTRIHDIMWKEFTEGKKDGVKYNGDYTEMMRPLRINRTEFRLLDKYDNGSADKSIVVNDLVLSTPYGSGRKLILSLPFATETITSKSYSITKGSSIFAVDKNTSINKIKKVYSEFDNHKLALVSYYKNATMKVLYTGNYPNPGSDSIIVLTNRYSYKDTLNVRSVGGLYSLLYEYKVLTNDEINMVINKYLQYLEKNEK